MSLVAARRLAARGARGLLAAGLARSSLESRPAASRGLSLALTPAASTAAALGPSRLLGLLGGCAPARLYAAAAGYGGQRGHGECTIGFVDEEEEDYDDRDDTARARAATADEAAAAAGPVPGALDLSKLMQQQVQERSSPDAYPGEELPSYMRRQRGGGGRRPGARRPGAHDGRDYEHEYDENDIENENENQLDNRHGYDELVRGRGRGHDRGRGRGRGGPEDEEWEDGRRSGIRLPKMQLRIIYEFQVHPSLAVDMKHADVVNVLRDNAELYTRYTLNTSRETRSRGAEELRVQAALGCVEEMLKEDPSTSVTQRALRLLTLPIAASRLGDMLGDVLRVTEMQDLSSFSDPHEAFLHTTRSVKVLRNCAMYIGAAKTTISMRLFSLKEWSMQMAALFTVLDKLPKDASSHDEFVAAVKKYMPMGLACNMTSYGVRSVMRHYSKLVGSSGVASDPLFHARFATVILEKVTCGADLDAGVTQLVSALAGRLLDSEGAAEDVSVRGGSNGDGDGDGESDSDNALRAKAAFIVNSAYLKALCRLNPELLAASADVKRRARATASTAAQLVSRLERDAMLDGEVKEAIASLRQTNLAHPWVCAADPESDGGDVVGVDDGAGTAFDSDVSSLGHDDAAAPKARKFVHVPPSAETLVQAMQNVEPFEDVCAHVEKYLAIVREATPYGNDIRGLPHAVAMAFWEREGSQPGRNKAAVAGVWRALVRHAHLGGRVLPALATRFLNFFVSNRQLDEFTSAYRIVRKSLSNHERAQIIKKLTAHGPEYMPIAVELVRGMDTPGPEVFAGLVAACNKYGMYNLVMSLLIQFRDRGLEMNEMLAVNLLDGLGYSGNSGLVEEVWDDVVRMGMLRDATKNMNITASAVEAALRCGSVHIALNMLAYVFSRNIPVTNKTATTFVTMLGHAANKGNQRAQVALDMLMEHTGVNRLSELEKRLLFDHNAAKDTGNVDVVDAMYELVKNKDVLAKAR